MPGPSERHLRALSVGPESHPSGYGTSLIRRLGSAASVPAACGSCHFRLEQQPPSQQPCRGLAPSPAVSRCCRPPAMDWRDTRRPGDLAVAGASHGGDCYGLIWRSSPPSPQRAGTGWPVPVQTLLLDT